MKPELFDISADVWNGLSEEVLPTIKAMREMGLYRLPIDGPFCIRLPLPIALSRHGTSSDIERLSKGHYLFRAEDDESFIGTPTMESHMEYRDMEKECGREYIVNTMRGGRNRQREMDEKLSAALVLARKTYPTAFREGNSIFTPYTDPMPPDLTEIVRNGLIVILASKGIAKSRKEHKLASLGVGKPSRFSATTTIRLIERLDDGDDVEAASRKPTRPHLRRGHIRHQAYGEGRALHKSIWIAPIFVNADAGFVSARQSYKIRPPRPI